MKLQNAKLMVSGAWALTVFTIAIGADVTWLGRLAIGTLGLLPPLALLHWWQEPAPTMSETIDQARR